MIKTEFQKFMSPQKQVNKAPDTSKHLRTNIDELTPFHFP